MIIIQILHHFPLKMNKINFIIFLYIFISYCPLWAKEIQLVDHKSIYDLSESDWYITEQNPLKEKEMNWIKINVPSNAKTITKKNEVWYKTIIKCKLPLKESIGIKLGIISDRDKVYWNGVLIGETGKWNSKYPEAYDKIRIYEIPPYVVKEENEVLIHVQGYFESEIGIIRNQPEIGSLLKLLKNYYHFYGGNLFILFIYFSVGSYFLFLFFRRLKERENLFFGIFMYILVIYFFLRNPLKYELTNNLFLLKRIEYIALFLIVPFFYFFIYYYYEKLFPKPIKEHRLFKAHKIVIFTFCYLTIASTIIILVFDDVQYWDQYNLYIIQYILWPPIVISSIIILFYFIHKKNLDAMIMFLGYIFVISGGIIDILINRNIINMVNISTFTFFAFIISLSTTLANRYVRLNIEIEELNKNLEQKVIERTQKLQESLEQIQKLKEKQDGDYFLTSLLLKPLNQNHAQSEIFEIETYLKQFKEFNFRNKKGEIGGDLIITDNIMLNEKPHIVFLNGDAMGKSIQGAGGSIVLGTVFLSILNRTKSKKSYKKKEPAKWLKECYEELQNVFITFDGSMLASVVLGVIDETDKILYFINAEHPGVVLYRNKKARFLQKETELKKLGVSFQTGPLKIYSFELAPKDMIFIGSDGKDDLELKKGDVSLYK
ncbi:MAG: stage II sporulation protein E [Leptospiraceae bacterium]|nr:MAG: stage II sporulation protein E [Leptospiraceae bacterium]